MPEYENSRGNSGVTWYESAPKSITITFANGAVYLYDEQHPGPAAVDRMKVLADSGTGLSSYISRVVRDDYACKLR